MGSRTDLGAAWGWGAVGALACASVAVLEPSVLEEGLPLHVAQRLVQGELLYRDVVFFTGPLPFEFLALLFRWFGEHVLVARAVVVALHALATASVFDLARRAGTGAFAHAAAAAQAAAPILLFPLFSMYFPSTLGTLLATLAVYAAARGTSSLRWAVGCGVLVACAALCKQTVGIALAATLVPGVALYAGRGLRLRTGGAVAAGGVAVAAATLALFALRGTAGELFASLVTMPLTLNETFRMPFPALWPPGDLGVEIWRNWPYYMPRWYVLAVSENPAKAWVRAMGLPAQLFYASPFAALALTALRAALGRLPAAAVLPAAGVLASTVGLFPRSDWGHLSMVLPAAWVQLVLAATAGRSERPRAGRVGAGLVVAGFGASAVALLGLYYGVAAPRGWDPRVPLRPVSEGYRSPAVPRVIEYLRSHASPGEAVFVARQEPLLYFVTGARNPTRYEGMMQGLRERQETEVLEAVSRLRYVVMSEIDGPAPGFYPRELPAVHAYLERHFRIPADFPLDADQWIVVYERGPDRGAASVDLVDAAASARYFVRAPDGRVERYAPERLPTAAIRHLRRPLAVPVGPLGGGVDFELVVPARARFEAGVGVFGVATTKGLSRRLWSSTYTVSLVRGGRAEPLWSAVLPADKDGVETWQTVEVDLSPYSGQRIALRLEVVPDEPKERVRVGWWGSPRIVSAAAPAEAPATPARVTAAPADAKAIP